MQIIIENKNHINFLDLTLIKNKEYKIEYIYRKTIQTDTIVPAFHTYINRIINTPLNKHKQLKEINIIINIAVNNGFNNNFIQKLIYKTTKNKYK